MNSLRVKEAMKKGKNLADVTDDMIFEDSSPRVKKEEQKSFDIT